MVSTTDAVVVTTTVTTSGKRGNHDYIPYWTESIRERDEPALSVVCRSQVIEYILLIKQIREEE